MNDILIIMFLLKPILKVNSTILTLNNRIWIVFHSQIRNQIYYIKQPIIDLMVNSNNRLNKLEKELKVKIQIVCSKLNFI